MPNPLTILTELFAKLHDKNFRVAVPGFYDDVDTVPAAERKALNTLPWKKKDFERAVGAPDYFGEKGFTTVERLWIRPTLEPNGIWGGYQGEGAKTVIPSKAYAKFSTRLVPSQNPKKIAKLVEKHIRKLLPKTVTCKFETLSTGKPWVAAYHDPIFHVAQCALEKGFGKKAVFIREGGSIPFVTQMHDTFKVPCVLIGFGLPDENAHAPDEHLALENYYGGIKAIAHLYEDLGLALVQHSTALDTTSRSARAPASCNVYRGQLRACLSTARSSSALPPPPADPSHAALRTFHLRPAPCTRGFRCIPGW